MFKKPTRKQFIIRRVILSTIATLSVIIIATAAILFMLGYRLDSGNRLAQGALLQLDSTPSGADIFIDGYSIGSRTSTKHTVVAGEHTVKMTRSGYKDWSRTLNLTAGTLTWLDYTRFVPVDRPVQKVSTHETLASTKMSPDKKWALLQEKADVGEFQLIDLRSQDIKVTSYTLPQTSYSEAETEGVTHTFTPVAWDTGGRYVTLKHLFKGQTEWMVLDMQNSGQTVNVTRLFNTGFKDVQFAGTSGKVLYGLTDDGTIRRIDLSGQTMSRAFITHVESFEVFNNSIVNYVGIDPNDGAKRVAGLYRDGDEAPHVLQTAPADEAPLKIATSRYFSNDYVAVAEGGVVTVYQGSYPSSSSQDNSSLSKVATFELSGIASALSFSPEGDYLVAQSAGTFMSYEVEHGRIASGTIAAANGRTASTLKWLDNAYVWNDDGGTLVMRDFNGANVHSIMEVSTGFDAGLSQNGRYFYAVGKDSEGFHLQRVKMILD